MPRKLLPHAESAMPESASVLFSVYCLPKEALAEMKIEMDEREFGKFVDNTVTELVYN